MKWHRTFIPLLIAGSSAMAENFSFEDLQNLLRAPNGPRSVDALVAALPADLRANYTLMRASSSSQSASATSPRAILFGTTGSMVLSFNGDGDTVELAQYRAGTPPRLELREIRFSEGRTPEISSANPGRCTECHGRPPQYLWAPYAQWPGAFGEHDDRVDPDSEEGRELRAFNQSRHKHGRYRHLVNPRHLATSVPPYHFTQDQRGLANMPNTRLTALVVRRTAQVTAGRMQQSPLFEKYRAVLASLVLECPAPPTAVARRILAELRSDSRANAEATRELQPALAPADWSNREAIARSLVTLLGVPPSAFNLYPENETLDRTQRALLRHRNKENADNLVFPEGSLHYAEGVGYLADYFLSALWTHEWSGIPTPQRVAYADTSTVEPRFLLGGHSAAADSVLSPILQPAGPQLCPALARSIATTFPAHVLEGGERRSTTGSH